MADPTGLYGYGAPVTVIGNTGGANPNTGVAVAPTGSSPHTPPSNATTVLYPGGAPTTELVGMYTPVLTTLTPATIAHGVANAAVNCTGSGFVPNTTTRAGTVIRVNGVDTPTTYGTPTALSYLGQHSAVAAAGPVTVTAVNLGISSGPQTFTYT